MELHVHAEKCHVVREETIRIYDIDVVTTITKLNDGGWKAVFRYHQMNDNSAKYLHAPGIECTPMLPILSYYCSIRGDKIISPLIIAPLKWVVHVPGKLIE